MDSQSRAGNDDGNARAVVNTLFQQRVADANTVIRLTVGVLISDQPGRVLLERRRDCGLWGIPGGRVEPGESLRQAALREAREETGLQVTLTHLVGVYSGPADHILTFPERVVQTVDVVIAATIASGALRRSDESEALAFFDAASLPAAGEVVAAARPMLRDFFSGARGVLA